MSDKPFIEDIAPPPDKPFIEDMLAPQHMVEATSLGGEGFDAYFTGQAGGKFLDQFGQGFKQGWGATPLGISPSTEKALRETGVWDDYQGALAAPVKRLNEAIMRPLAVSVDFAMRAPYAFARGLAETASPLALLGGPAAAGMEAFPVGHFTGFPGGVHPLMLDRAHDMGVTDERYPGIVPGESTRQEPPTPKATEPLTDRPIMDPLTITMEEQGPPRDVHEFVRQLHPEVMEPYDAAIEAKDEAQGRLEQQREVEAKPFRDQIAEILDKVNGVRDRLTKAAAERLATAEHNLEYTLGHDSPERAGIRRDVMAVDERMRDMAPALTDAYRDARARMPEPPSTEPEVPPLTEAEVSRTFGEELPATTKDIDIKPNGAGFDINTKEGTFYAANENEAGRLLERYGGISKAEVLNFLQRRRTISADVTQRLQAAGRPLDEARASAALVQAHYEARAARFNGALGSARDLYAREAPMIESAEGRARGQLNLADNTIRLMKDADASTFVHESAHSWLEELRRDAQDERAPADVRADMDAVNSWLGVEGTISRAQHEKFARGFERYLMEGTAPSAKLANVFSRFRQWLLGIYGAVGQLRAPINDQIRGVYARLLEAPRTETIIAPERPVGRDFADVHEADLAAATPEDAVAKANEVRAERDAVAETLRPEVNNARRRARESGPTAERGTGETGTEGTPVLSTTAEERGLEPGGTEDNAKPVEVVPSGSRFKAKSTAPANGHEEFGATGDRLVDPDGRLILENIESPDDVDTAIRRVADQGDRRGAATDGQLYDLSAATGIDPQLIPRSLSHALDAGQIEALTKLAIDANTDVHNKMIQVAEGGDVLDMAVAISRLEMIQAKAQQSAAAWGRAGQAYREFKSMTGGAAADALNAALVRATGRSYDVLMQLALQHNILTTPSQVGAAIHQSHGKVTRGIVYIIMNAFLSNPLTHSVYLAGNELRNLLLPVETAVSASVGKLRTSLNIIGDDRVYMKEAGAQLSGYLTGHKNAWIPAAESFKAGQQMPLPGQKGFTNPWGGSYASPFPESINNVVGFPGKSVAAIHQFARIVFYEQHLQSLATRMAIEEGLNGDALDRRIAGLIRNPQAIYPLGMDIMRMAADRADTDMFQRRGGFNSLTRAIEGYTDKYAVAKVVFPFVKIGMEITREAFVKRTPLGLFSQEVRGDLLGRRGGAAFDEAAGKQLVGLSLIGMGIGGAAAGLITGPGPSDPKARSSWLLTHKPNSIAIGNLWVPLKGLGPPGIVFGLGVDAWETAAHWDGRDGEKLATAYMKALSHSVLDESFFRSASAVNGAMTDPDRHASQYLENLVSGAVPYSSFLGAVNRAFIDPYSKDVEPGFRGFVDALRARIPIASWDVANKVDMWGNDVPSRGSILNPSTLVNRYADDATTQWLNKLETGPGRMDRTIGSVRLTEQQYVDLQRSAGRQSKILLDAARPMLETQSHGIQLKEVDRILNIARGMARKQVMMESLGTSNDIVKQGLEKKEELLK